MSARALLRPSARGWRTEDIRGLRLAARASRLGSGSASRLASSSRSVPSAGPPPTSRWLHAALAAAVQGGALTDPTRRKYRVVQMADTRSDADRAAELRAKLADELRAQGKIVTRAVEDAIRRVPRERFMQVWLAAELRVALNPWPFSFGRRSTQPCFRCFRLPCTR